MTLEVIDLKNIKLPQDEGIKLKKLEFQGSECHGVFVPTSKDEEFEIEVMFDLKDSPTKQGVDAKAILNLFKNKKKIRYFNLNELLIKNTNDYVEFISDIFNRSKNFIKNTLNQYARDEFKMKWTSEQKTKIIKKVAFKLSKEDKKLSPNQVKDALMKFVDRQEMDNENYAKTIKLDDEKHDILRNIYDNGKVKQLYTYGMMKFGFEVMGLRFDVTAGYAEIKKIKAV